MAHKPTALRRDYKHTRNNFDNANPTDGQQLSLAVCLQHRFPTLPGLRLKRNISFDGIKDLKDLSPCKRYSQAFWYAVRKIIKVGYFKALNSVGSSYE